MIRFYLGEEPILAQRADVPCCYKPDELDVRARAPGGAGGQGGARRGRLRHADRPARRKRPERDAFRARIRRATRQVHRAADARAIDLPDVRRGRARAAPRRPAALRAVGQDRSTSCPAASRASRCAKARWSSTRRKAAGPKDTWVRRELTHAAPRPPSDLYWMARHVERAENTARLLDVTYRTSLLPYEPSEPGLAWAGALGGPAHQLRPRHRVLREASSARRRERAALHDPRRDATPSSIFCLRCARRASPARGARSDHLRDVRGPERGLARDARDRLRARVQSRGVIRVPRVGEDALAPVPRRDVRHDAARRGVPASSASARTSSAPTTPRASSTPSTTSLLPSRRRRRRRASTTTSGRRCCASVSGLRGRTARSTAT